MPGLARQHRAGPASDLLTHATLASPTSPGPPLFERSDKRFPVCAHDLRVSFVAMITDVQPGPTRVVGANARAAPGQPQRASAGAAPASYTSVPPRVLDICVPRATLRRMAVEFKDKGDRSLHEAFQSWRRRNPGGFLLAFRTRYDAVMHRSLGCAHLGGENVRVSDYGHSLTRKRKVCAATSKELATYAVAKQVSVSLCSRCKPSETSDGAASTDATASAALHIAVGAAGEDKALRTAVEEHGQVRWPLPKRANAGDSVLFCIPSWTGPIVARGIVRVSPTADRGRVAVISEVEWLPRSLELAVLQQELPKWGWPRRAQAFTTVPPEFVDRVHELTGLLGPLPQMPDFDPTNTDDGRRRLLTAVVQRQGQGEFRRALVQAYRGRCAVSGCKTLEVVDAAHIVPFRGKHTNHVTNGLLLRTDLHTLFDLGLMSVDPSSNKVYVAAKLRNGEYGRFHGRRVGLPTKPAEHPSREALRGHFANRHP
ncbi:MAG: hypothetical protein CMLOHMNK_03633 [Steroidobacteraceae bacterium]|nr:hypothetical protein [Steroidobacteraceae bacterium]